VTTAVRSPGTAARDDARMSGARPVLLATVDAPLLAEASTTAVDAAVESGQPLLVVNAVETALTRSTLTFGHQYIAPPGVEESLSAPALLASSLGVRVERIRLRSPRPIEALLELAAERDVGLLVLGPDPKSMRRWRYRRTVKKMVERAPCLVWVA
jgi:nucleotide-binding universal stress UspA family protein